MLGNFLSPAIGLIYAGLVQKAISVSLDRTKFESINCYMQNEFNRSDFNRTDFKREDSCYENKEKIIDNLDAKSLYYSMSIAIITIIIAVLMYKTNRHFSTGISFGAFLLVVYNVLVNWNRFDDKQRLVTYSISFIVLGGFTLKYFKN